MSSKLLSFLDLVAPTETDFNYKTIIILVVALVVVLTVALVATKKLKKNSNK